jgi:putative hydrolase of the HAD superfamily
MHYTTLFIDLDETIYPPACGVWDAISVRIEQFMHERMNLALDSIPQIRTGLYQQYGTTLRGLQIIYGIDEREYIDYVHDVPLDRHLQPDPQLRDMLLGYPAQKVIFTNADRNHAKRVIEAMQLMGCFTSVIDIYDQSPYCKPMAESFAIALKMAGESEPKNCVFIDDSPRNLLTAREMGFYTVQVGSPKAGLLHPNGAAHAAVARLIDLPKVLKPLADIEMRNQ